MSDKLTGSDDRCVWCGQRAFYIGESKAALWLSDSGELFHKACHAVMSRRFELLGVRDVSKLTSEWK